MRASIYSACVLLICLSAYFRFNHNGQHLPEGCDVFGFLYMSEAISEGNLFGEHTPRSFLPELINHLESEGFQYKDYAWILAPHAYHVEIHNKKIINQYPPGTSILMSALPKSKRQEFFAVLILFLMLLIPGIVIRNTFSKNENRNLAYLLVLAVVTYAVLSQPMLTELIKVNSTAPTFGLLLAAGLLFEKRPSMAIYLISLSCIFRIANILLIFPMGIYLIFGSQQLSFRSLRTYMGNGLKLVLIMLSGGVGFYLLYNFLLLGNPFFPTYSEIDQRSIGISTLNENLNYYFIKNTGWLWLNLISAAVLVYFRNKKLLGNSVFFSLLLCLPFVYLYFIFHFIRTPYYPYAPSLIILGFLIYKSAAEFKIIKKLVIPAYVVIISIFLAVGLREGYRYFSSDRESYSGQVEKYRKTFDGYDVVWGELRTSTVEYSCGIPAMRLLWGREEIAIKIIRWLKDRNYKQAVILTDIGDFSKPLISVLTNEHLEYKIRESRDFGKILTLD